MPKKVDPPKKKYSKEILPFNSPSSTGRKKDLFVEPKILTEEEKQALRFQEIKNKQGSIKGITKKEYEDSKSAPIGEILRNPMTALKRKVKGQAIPKNFSKDTENTNPYDHALAIVNPLTYLDAAVNTGKNLLHPVNTAKALTKGAINLTSNLVDNRNIYEDGSNEKALGIIGDAALAMGIKSGVKDGFRIADKQFSKVGQQLEKIRMEGEAAGLDTYTIAKNQMEQVGITSNQRQAYNPIVSNFAEKYITPYSYEGFESQSKLRQTWENIKKGGIDFGKNDKGALSRQHVTNERGDAWKLYLGKPQTKGTFKLSDTAPVNHPSYSGQQLKGMDVYNLEAAGAQLGIEPGYISPSLLNPYSIEEKMNLLRNRVNIDRGNEVMGGYNRLLSRDGMQYNDIWDLNPHITPSKYLPSKYADKLDENPIFYKKTENGFLPRSVKISVDNFLGKPFMSHGTLPYTSQNLVDNLQGALKTQITELTNSGIDMTPRITKYEKYMEELKNYPKYKKGGVIKKEKGKIKKARNGFTSDPTFPTKDPNPFYGVPPFVQEEISFKDQNPFYGTSPVEIMERRDIGKLQKIKPKSLINTPEIKPKDRSIPPKEDKQKTDWSNILAAGLQGINGLIPRGDIKRQYLRPEDQLTYNQNPYGTESQAIMNKGGKIKGKKMPMGGLLKIDPNFIRTTGRGRPAPAELAQRQDMFLSNEPMSSLKHWDGIQGKENENLSEKDWFKNNLEYLINNSMNSNNYYDSQSHYSTTPRKQPMPNDLLAYAEMGGKMSMKKGGALQTHSGGSAPQVSTNPFDGGMGEFKGNSHENGGIKASFSGKPFEAEGGEPYRIAPNGDLEIFGALKNPITGNTFKKDGKMLVKKEQIASKYSTLGAELVNSLPEQKDKFELLKFNSGQAMLRGGLGEQKRLAKEKETLSLIQRAMLQEESPEKAQWGANYSKSFNTGRQKFKKNTINIYGNALANPYQWMDDDLNYSVPVNNNQVPFGPLNMNQGRGGMPAQQGFSNVLFEDGGQMKGNEEGYYDKGKPWKYKGTNNKSLDEKIKGFVKLVEEKGLEGYSGAKSGYDKRNTKSGRPSRHASNQALDMIFSDPNAYQTILNDPELSSYLYDNGLTAINEYDPTIAKKTGATAGHLHIGYDKGTKTADRFREDYKSLYKPSKTNPAIPSPLIKPLPGAAMGDAQTEQSVWNPEQYMFNTPKQNPPAPPAQQETQPFNFTNPKPQTAPAIPTRFPWEQALPVLPALFDQPDPVQMQQYTPDLYEDYEVSFQDRRNRNTAQLRGVAQAAGYDPSALGTLGAQAYQANNDIDAEEFRVNQGITNDVVNKNIGLINDAELKNLGIIDQQYVRQTQAIGNTRDRRSDALIQLGDLVAQNSLENKTLNVYHNLYKDYTYDKNGQLQYVGPTAAERIGAQPVMPTTTNTKSTVTTKTGNKTVQDVYEPIKDFRPQIRKSLRKSFKEGGVVTQSKLAKFMNS